MIKNIQAALDKGYSIVISKIEFLDRPTDYEIILVNGSYREGLENHLEDSLDKYQDSFYLTLPPNGEYVSIDKDSLEEAVEALIQRI